MSDETSTDEEAGVPAAAPSTRFQPGHAKVGGRRRGVPNRDRQLTIGRILELVDPLEGLARIARGEPMMLATEPGGEPRPVYPTIGDVRAALTVLAGKVMPDLRSVSLENTGNEVHVFLQLGPTAAPASAPSASAAPSLAGGPG